jgi:hypothetical protein
MPLEIPTQEDIDDWNEFLNDPEHATVREVAARFPPWDLFRMTDTGQIVSVMSWFEDGTIMVYIDPEHNSKLDFRTGFAVFGVDPNVLEPWLPKLDG